MSEGRNVDVLVVGGGPAGFAAALAASRTGASTLLIERSGRLGGMATNALVSPFLGMVKGKFVNDIIDHLGGRQVDPSTLDLNYADMLVQDNAQILLHTCATNAIMDGDRVTGCSAFTKQGRIDISAAVTIDASGDGDIAYSAGGAIRAGSTGRRPYSARLHYVQNRRCRAVPSAVRQRGRGGRPYASCGHLGADRRAWNAQR